MIALVAGSLANKPGNGGNAWSRLSWTRGLQRLGFDVCFVEQLHGVPTPAAVGFFEEVARQFGARERWALLGADGEPLAGGLSTAALHDAASRAELLINLSGHLQEPALRRLTARAIYVDDDPGYTQFWHASGAIGDHLAGHVAHYSFGTRIGLAGCPIPTAGIGWRPLRPPVVLADWPALPTAELERVTTVASWRGPYGPVDYDGVRYGQKVHEFRRFVSLPLRAGRRLEVALAVDPAEAEVANTLRASGWDVVEPLAAAGDPTAFRSYVQASAAEFSVAQQIYVATGSGWFSDRTTRYLASGKPAIVQDTGFSAELPTGEGLLAFSTPDEAAARLAALERDFDRHAAAARAIAAEHFDSDLVIGRLLEEVL